ncbi:MAG TPA: 4a-hydroxytetrahydrobiopterin dehydratase [Candidatus Paceibacterota bacterium]
MSQLSEKRCIPCEGGTLPLSRSEAEVFLKQVNGWALSKDACAIHKEFKFKNFAQAMDFGNAVARIAEEEEHHPDLSISWGKVDIHLTTHAIKGLSENDFILAAKVDKIA